MRDTTRRRLEDACFWGLVLGVIVFAVLGFTLLWLGASDSTSDSTGGSGTLRIDEATGCHYLGPWWSSPTPRVDPQGRHICTGREGEALLLEGVTEPRRSLYRSAPPGSLYHNPDSQEVTR